MEIGLSGVLFDALWGLLELSGVFLVLTEPVRGLLNPSGDLLKRCRQPKVTCHDTPPKTLVFAWFFLHAAVPIGCALP